MIVDVVDTFVATDEFGPVNYVMPYFEEVAEARDALENPTIRVDVVEVFLAADAFEVENYLAILETFYASDEVTIDVTHRQTVVETLRARDRITAHLRVPVDVVETLVATDTAPAPTIVFDMADVFYAVDEVAPVGNRQADLEDVFHASEEWAFATVVDVLEAFSAQDTFSAKSVSRHDTLETFFAGDDLDAVLTIRADIEELFYAADEVLPVSRIVVDVVEVIYLYDEISATTRHYGTPVFEPTDDSEEIPLAATDVWTADGQSWGMSRYVNVPVHEFDGVQFGLGPDGLFAMESLPVLSFVETGDMALRNGDERVMVRKRLNYVYTYSRHPEPLSILVTADYRGERLSTLYTQEDRSSSNTRAVRCQTGRGYASNYIKLRVGGENVFDLAGLEVEVTPTGRRI